ncbi:MAG: delta-60 repeat domain-containing protein, partial [Hyphomicrobiaceae bacterium]
MANTAPVFGVGDGIVTTPIGISTDTGQSVALQPDGKIIVAGYGVVGSTVDFAVVRYNPDGTLDTSFGGGDGIVTTPVGSSNDLGLSVALQSDGRIVVAGYSYNGANNDFALVRYNADGSLDDSFGGGDGIVTTPIGSSHDQAYSVALQSDGRVVVAGYSRIGLTDDVA